MNELKSIIQDIKQQMPHAFLKLFFWLMFIKVVNMALSDVLHIVMDTQSNGYLIVNFVTSFFMVACSNTVMFLFIKTVRKESFQLQDIIASAKMLFYHVITALVLSILQSIMQMIAVMFAFIPMLAIIVMLLIQAIFLYWNAIVAYAIYDQNKSLKAYFAGAARMLLVNYKLVLLISIPYILICLITQQLGISLYQSVFTNIDNFDWIITSLMAAKNQWGMILLTYISFHGLQIFIITILFMIMANLYDRYAHIYMSNQNPLLEKGDKK